MKCYDRDNIHWRTWKGVAGGVGSIERVAGVVRLGRTIRGGGEWGGGGSVLVNYFDFYKN